MDRDWQNNAQQKQAAAPWVWHDARASKPVLMKGEAFSVYVLISQQSRMQNFVVAYYDTRDDMWHPGLYQQNTAFPLAPDAWCYMRLPDDFEEEYEGELEHYRDRYGIEVGGK